MIRKKFLLVNIILFFLIIVLYFVLNIKLSDYIIRGLANIQGFLNEKKISVWDASFEEANISSLKSFSIRNFRFGFDYPSNNLKLKLSLKIDHIYVSWSDFSVKQIAIKAKGIQLKYLNSDNTINTNWLSENYPFVGLQGDSVEFVFNNEQGDIRKTVETNLQELFNLFALGQTKLKFSLLGKFKFNKSEFVSEKNIEVFNKDNVFSLKVDFDEFIADSQYLQLDKNNLSSIGDYFYFTYLLDLESYLAKEIENALKNKTDFPVDIYSKILTGFILKLFFKEEYVAQFIESKIKTSESGQPQNIIDMNLNNFKMGMTYADSNVKEEDLKKLIFEDKRIRLRPSNFSIKIK